MINAFREIDLIKSVRALLDRTEFLESIYDKHHLTISGGDFSNLTHDIDLDGGSF